MKRGVDSSYWGLPLWGLPLCHDPSTKYALANLAILGYEGGEMIWATAAAGPCAPSDDYPRELRSLPSSYLILLSCLRCHSPTAHASL
eukprot:3738989-Pleurochrysis_carterae.AAC.1